VPPALHNAYCCFCNAIVAFPDGRSNTTTCSSCGATVYFGVDPALDRILNGTNVALSFALGFFIVWRIGLLVGFGFWIAVGLSFVISFLFEIVRKRLIEKLFSERVTFTKPVAPLPRAPL
jgi:hypothetical protein